MAGEGSSDDGGEQLQLRDLDVALSYVSNQFDSRSSWMEYDTAENGLQDQTFDCSRRLGLLEFSEERAATHPRLRAFVH